MNIVLGNLFGGIASIFVGMSVHRKNKKEMLFFQIFSKDFKKIKISVFFNEFFWFIYMILIQNYIQAITMLILCINTIISLKMSNESIADNGLTKYQREWLNNVNDSHLYKLRGRKILFKKG